ncbi:hypothetical protein Syun_023240 [Stephania yunnanensis]|uniref:Uncharacterized protein n=1 Tax=Stephania yunnanensis TaxID=152371 RepID=A0AAP0FNE3_9MAGN
MEVLVDILMETGLLEEEILRNLLIKITCKAKRLSKETCFKLHGTFDWYNKGLEKKQHVNTSPSFANMLESSLDMVDEGALKFEDL